jgi:hydrogenase maturation protein HypF
MIEQIVSDGQYPILPAVISAKFHNALTRTIVEIARRVGQPRVVLTGGCFQNVYLLEHTVQQLRAAGFVPYWHQRVPPNDGGLSLGQIYAGRTAMSDRMREPMTVTNKVQTCV